MARYREVADDLRHHLGVRVLRHMARPFEEDQARRAEAGEQRVGVAAGHDRVAVAVQQEDRLADLR